MSSTPFGEHLKREREMRGVSLEEIAAATRINTRYLEALEKHTGATCPAAPSTADSSALWRAFSVSMKKG